MLAVIEDESDMKEQLISCENPIKPRVLSPSQAIPVGLREELLVAG